MPPRLLRPHLWRKKSSPATVRTGPTPRVAIALGALSFVAALLACQAPGSVTVTPPPSTPTPLPPTQTATPDVILLIREEGLSDASLEDLVNTLQTLSGESGLRLEQAAPSSAPLVTPATRLVISYGSEVDASLLARDHPGVQVIAIGAPGLEPAPNLLVIGPKGFRGDQQGFVAGYAAALAIPGFRVAVLSPQDRPQALPAAAGFLQGAVFYCGLCNPARPPFVEYPMQLSTSTQESEMAAVVSALQAAEVGAVYIPDRAALQELAPLLTNEGLLLLGPGLPDESLRPSWLVSVRADPASAVRSAWPEALAGRASGSRAMPLHIADAHPDWLSPGKLALLDSLLQALAQGEVDTGVDPLTGQLENVGGG